MGCPIYFCLIARKVSTNSQNMAVNCCADFGGLLEIKTFKVNLFFKLQMSNEFDA